MAELELFQAQLRHAKVESSKHDAAANWHAQESRVLRLENAKLRRMLRAHGAWAMALAMVAYACENSTFVVVTPAHSGPSA